MSYGGLSSGRELLVLAETTTQLGRQRPVWLGGLIACLEAFAFSKLFAGSSIMAQRAGGFSRFFITETKGQG